MKRVPLRSSIATALAALFLGLQAQPALADDSQEQILRLEEQMRALMQELERVKAQVEERRDRATPGPQPSAAPAPVVGWREGVQFDDPQGNWSLRFFGRGQLDYRHYDPSGVSADTFSVRRARLGASMSFMKHYGFTLEGEYATGNAATGTQSAALTNGFLDFNWFPNARIRAGQFKPQFGLENTQSANFTDFQERALTQSLLQNLNYDRGVMVWGQPLDWLGYAITVSNGTGLNTEASQSNAQEAANDGKDLTVRVYANAARALDRQSAIVHLGVSHKTGTTGSRAGTAFRPAAVQTEARGVTFFNSATLGLGTVDRDITALEGAVAWGPVKFQTEYWRARYEGKVPQDYKRDLEAGYVSLVWMITGEHYSDAYRNGGWGRMRPRTAFAPGGGSGAWEVGLRYSVFDGSDFTSTNPAGTGVLDASAATVAPPVTVSTDKADAVTLGLKWMPNAYARMLLNYVDTRFDTPVTANGKVMHDEKALTLRAQIDF